MGMTLQGVESFLQQKVDPNFHFIDNRQVEVPFTQMDKPVQEAKVALISSGGFHLKTESAFDTNDPQGDASFRKIPLGSSLEDLGIAHTHYDHKYVEEDLNCALPIEILQKMADAGQIGQVAKTHYSFMGYILRTEELIRETAPKVAAFMKGENVDAAILAPT